MKSAKSHTANETSGWRPANPILRTFRDRILQFLLEGLNKIWFQLYGDEEFELAGALGFTEEDYLNILKFGGFTTVDFAIRTDRIAKMIGIDIDVNIQYNNAKDSGKTTREYWIRFKNDTFASYSRKLKLTADEERSTPYDGKRDDFIGDFYIRGQRRSK
jgi:hypothetical protein